MQLQQLTALRARLLERLQPLAWQRPLLAAAAIGVLGALCTIGFRESIQLIERLAYGRNDSLVAIAASLPWWQRLLAPAIGGVIAGLLLAWARRVPQARGGDYMEAVVLGNGDLSVRASLLRACSSAFTVASGGAIGREGPMVQLAALTGALFGRWRALPVPRRRLYVACGAAAGIATAYNAPIAGALFVAEIVLRSLAIESLGPLIVAAVAANLVVVQVAGLAPVYQMPALQLHGGSPTLLLSVLGVAAGLLAPAYLALLDGGRALFKRWHGGAPWQQLALGGLLVGAISLLSPAVWGNGYSVVNSVLQGGWLWQALLTVLVLKLLAVAATTGSGAVGGIFTPTLFMGAVTGALFGNLCHWLWPDLVPVPAAVAVGMGAFLAACTHAPLMSILMIFEMTESYSVIVPLMAACVLGYSISRVLRPHSIYSGINNGRQHAPSLAIAADLLRNDPPCITVGQSMGELEAVFKRYRWQHVYVTESDGRFAGAISLHDFAPFLQRHGDSMAAWPAALIRYDYPRVQDTAPTWKVMEIFAGHPGERLPVLDDTGRLLGYLTKTDLVLMFRGMAGEG